MANIAVSNTIKLPGGGVPARTSCVIDLVTDTGGGGFLTGLEVLGSQPGPVDSNGTWTVTLTPNVGTGAITSPTTTYYRVTETADGMTSVYYIQVNGSGSTTRTADQVLYNVPTPPPTVGSILGANFLEFTQMSAPASPASGSRRVYEDSADGHLKVKLPGGTLIDFEALGATAAAKQSVSAVVYFDAADSLYKFWNVLTSAVGATTSATDAAVVFNAAFTAIGKGMVGYYQDLTVLTNIALLTGCSLIGGGTSEGGTGAGPTITTGGGFTAGAPVINIAGGGTPKADCTLAFISVSASTGAARALSIQGDDAYVLNCSFVGGTADTTSITGTRWTVQGMRTGNSSGSNTSVWGGADGIASVVKVGGNTGNGPIFKINSSTVNGLQFHEFHLNASGSSPAMTVDGIWMTFTNFYVDGVGGTASIQVLSTAGKITFSGIFIRSGGSPGSIPMFKIDGGVVSVSNCICGLGPAGNPGGTWNAVADVASGAVFSISNSPGLTNFSTVGLAAFTGLGTIVVRACSVDGTFVDNGVGGVKENTTITTVGPSSTTETDLVTFTLPANRVKVGARYRFTLRGTHLNNSGSPCDYTWRVYAGGVLISGFAITKTTSAATLGLFVSSDLIFISLGSSGSAVANSHANMGAVVGQSTTTAVATVNTTAAIIIKITGQMSLSNANTQFSVFPASLEKVALPNGE